MIDLLLIAVLAVYGYFGYRRGFISGMGELVGFILGLVIAFVLYRLLGSALAGLFPRVPRGLVDLGSFMLVWTVVELLFAYGWKRVRKRIPEHLAEHPANRIAGTIPSLLRGIALLVITLLILATAPIPTSAKAPFTESNLGKAFLSLGTAFQQQVNGVFGRAFRDTLAFRTVKTGSTETTELGFTDKTTPECLSDARALFDRTNQERAQRGLRQLTWDDDLRRVGLAHSRDMLARGFFSHVNPDGLDPFDRMERAGITYLVAGENLAFAPTVGIAHTGLMNSPGHRANILKPEYRELGIGCADAGIRGQMYSQEFKG